MYSLDLAGVLAGTLTADDSGVGADLCTGTAFLALSLVDVSDMMLVERDGAEAADVLAAVCKAAAAGVGDFVSAHRALVAGDLDDLDDVGVILVSAHSELYSLSENGALLIDAAAHCGSVSGYDHFRNVHARSPAGDRSMRDARPRAGPCISDAVPLCQTCMISAFLLP